MDKETFTTQAYPHRYFTGSNVRLYIENIHLEEAAALQFVGQQPMIPLYAYDNCSFVRTSKGKKLVTGQIVINFVDEGYLHYVLKDIKTKKSDEIIKKAEETSVDEALGAAVAGEKRAKDSTPSVVAIAGAKKSLPSALAVAGTKESLVLRSALNILKTPRGKELMTERMSKFFDNSDITAKNVMYNKDKFNMFLVFGEPGSAVFTRKAFYNCQITGNQMILDINSGQHIAESYGFICESHQ